MNEHSYEPVEKAMPLLGNAAVAMWWTIAPADRTEFREWHSKEHFPERMGIDGFRRGTRWQAEDGSGDHFVLYELADYAVLTSDGYRDRLNNPTPWSRKMMPLHHGMVRSQARIEASHGAGVATFLRTLTLSPREGQADRLRGALDTALGTLAGEAGITGAHLLITDTPAAVATTEQQIRGADTVADWIVVVSGFGSDALGSALSGRLAAANLQGAKSQSMRASPLFRLVHSVTPRDFGLAG